MEYSGFWIMKIGSVDQKLWQKNQKKLVIFWNVQIFFWPNIFNWVYFRQYFSKSINSFFIYIPNWTKNNKKVLIFLFHASFGFWVHFWPNFGHFRQYDLFLPIFFLKIFMFLLKTHKKAIYFRKILIWCYNFHLVSHRWLFFIFF